MSIEVCPQLCVVSAKLEINEHYTELDSHADMCVVGRNAKITHTHEQKVLVSGYDKTLGKKEYNVVSRELAYEDPQTGKSIILKIHQAIYIPTMRHNLLLPIQLMTNGVQLDAKPKFLHPTPLKKLHLLTAPFLGTGHGVDPLIIHFSLSGIVSYFPTRTPTEQEFNNALRVELTAIQLE